MKRVGRALLIALAFASTPVAPAGANWGLSGTYATTITSPVFFKGAYRITFTPGHFVVHAPYGIVGRGTDTISGSKITLHGPGQCKAPGTYAFRLSATSVRFKKIRDSCPREVVLATHPLRRV